MLEETRKYVDYFNEAGNATNPVANNDNGGTILFDTGKRVFKGDGDIVQWVAYDRGDRQSDLMYVNITRNTCNILFRDVPHQDVKSYIEALTRRHPAYNPATYGKKVARLSAFGGPVRK